MILFDKPVLANTNEGYFVTAKGGKQLFIYDYKPIKNYNSTIFIISGITGINHHREKDLIDLLAKTNVPASFAAIENSALNIYLNPVCILTLDSNESLPF